LVNLMFIFLTLIIQRQIQCTKSTNERQFQAQNCLMAFLLFRHWLRDSTNQGRNVVIQYMIQHTKFKVKY